jgi:ribonuclease HI
MMYQVHTDGGARGNPGPAAIGVVIEVGQGAGSLLISEFGMKIGETTNNVAEYTAVVEALKKIKELQQHSTLEKNSEIHFFLDSLLVVNQLNGLFKVKDAKMRNLLLEVRMEEAEVGGKIIYTAVRRTANIRADFLVNQALDA